MSFLAPYSLLFDVFHFGDRSAREMWISSRWSTDLGTGIFVDVFLSILRIFTILRLYHDLHAYTSRPLFVPVINDSFAARPTIYDSTTLQRTTISYDLRPTLQITNYDLRRKPFRPPHLYLAER
jgi:hypothetical protein